VLGMGVFHEFLTGLCCHRNRCCFLLNHLVPLSIRSPRVCHRSIQLSLCSCIHRCSCGLYSRWYRLPPCRWNFLSSAAAVLIYTELGINLVQCICNTGSSMIISKRYK